MTSLTAGLAYAVLPPLVGWLLAVTFTLRASGGTHTDRPRVFVRLLVLLVLPATPVVFGLVGALLAAMGSQGLRTPLLVLGAATLLTALLQARVMAGGARDMVADPDRFGRVLARAVLPEVLAILALVWFIVQWVPVED